MKDYIDAGKHMAGQYQEMCSRIMSITERMAEEYEALYEATYRAREIDMPDKNREKTSPVETVAILIEKMRNEMDARYVGEISELEQKRITMESIIKSADLSAAEDEIFYLRYGMRRRRLRLNEIGDMVYYSERQVKRVLERCYLKIGLTL